MSWPFTDTVRTYARGYAERNMSSVVSITRPAASTFNSTTGNQTAVTQALVYRGKARVYSSSGPSTYNLGEENQYYQSLNVSVPLYVDGFPVNPQVDDIVEIVSHTDPLAVGKLYRVMDVELAGPIAASRRMQVTGIQKYRGWVASTPPSESENAPDSPVGEIPPEWRV